MPIYEYVCLDCGDRFEVLRTMREADQPIACKECESDHTSRLLAMFYAPGSQRETAGGYSGGGCAGCGGGSCSTCGR